MSKLFCFIISAISRWSMELDMSARLFIRATSCCSTGPMTGGDGPFPSMLDGMLERMRQTMRHMLQRMNGQPDGEERQDQQQEQERERTAVEQRMEEAEQRLRDRLSQAQRDMLGTWGTGGCLVRGGGGCARYMGDGGRARYVGGGDMLGTRGTEGQGGCGCSSLGAMLF